MTTVRLGRLDGPCLTFRISKQAEKRWAAVPKGEKEHARLSVLRAYKEMIELPNANISAARQEEHIESRRGLPCPGEPWPKDELRLLALWRRGDDKGVRRMFAARPRPAKEDAEIDDVLRLYWWGAGDFMAITEAGEDDEKFVVSRESTRDTEPETRKVLRRLLPSDGPPHFGLCWFSFEALGMVLKEWGFPLQSATALARRCQRLGLVSLPSPVSNKKQVECRKMTATIR